MRAIFSALAIILFTGISAQQIKGVVKGKIIDSLSREEIMGTIVYLKIDGQIYSTSTDFNGNYELREIPFGTHELFVSHVAYKDKSQEIQIKGLNTLQNVLNFELTEGHVFEEFEYVEFDNHCTCVVIYPEIEPIVSVPLQRRNLNYLAAALLSSVQVSLNGRKINFRGAKSNDVLYSVDGVKSINMPLIPFNALQEVRIYDGGIPAKFGDSTGGVIEVKTKSYIDVYREKNR